MKRHRELIKAKKYTVKIKDDNNEYEQLTNTYMKPRLAIYILHNLHVHPIGFHILILALNSANVLSTLYPQELVSKFSDL